MCVNKSRDDMKLPAGFQTDEKMPKVFYKIINMYFIVSTLDVKLQSNLSCSYLLEKTLKHLYHAKSTFIMSYSWYKVVSSSLTPQKYSSVIPASLSDFNQSVALSCSPSQT